MEMNEPKTTQRLYDIAEYSEKVRSALEKLKKTQKPGEQSGRGTKTTVLQTARTEIEELVKEGYTVKQIADALTKDDIFGILPKTITQLIGGKKQKTAKTKNKHIPVRAAAQETPGKASPTGSRITEIGDVE
jgi:hypothetical protein